MFIKMPSSNNSSLSKALFSLALAGFLVTPAALAEATAPTRAKSHIAQVGDIRAATKKISDMMRGKIPYDPVALAASARTIRAHGGETLSRMFPEESLQGTVPERPTSWDRWEAFEALAYDLERQGDGLVRAAEREANPADEPQLATVPGDSDAAPEAGHQRRQDPPKLVFLRVLKSCMSCHRSFRELQ